MNILLTGATGFVGRSLAEKLLEQGHTLFAVTRNVEKASKNFLGNITFFSYNESDILIPEDIFKKLDGVIHLAGESVIGKRWTDHLKKKIIASRSGMTELIVQKLKGTSQLKFFITASAVGYYGDRGGELLTESSHPGSGFLADVCMKWENALFLSPIECRKVAFRIGLILDHGGGAIQKLLPLFKSGLGGNLGNGKQWMSWIHREDLISLILFSVANEAVSGALNAVSPGVVQNKTFTKTLSKVLSRPAFFHVPSFALKLAMGEMSQVLLSSQRVEPKEALRLGFSFKYSHLNDAFTEICKENSTDA